MYRRAMSVGYIRWHSLCARGAVQWQHVRHRWLALDFRKQQLYLSWRLRYQRGCDGFRYEWVACDCAGTRRDDISGNGTGRFLLGTPFSDQLNGALRLGAVSFVQNERVPISGIQQFSLMLRRRIRKLDSSRARPAKRRGQQD